MARHGGGPRLRPVESTAQRRQDQDGDFPGGIGGGVNPLENPLECLSISAGENRKIAARPLRIEGRIQSQSERPRSQPLLDHAKPHADHHLALKSA